MVILTIAHNHPFFHPGGTEAVAWALCQSYRKMGFESYFLGGLDPAYRPEHAGTAIQTLEGAEGVYLFRNTGFSPFQQLQTRYDHLIFDLKWLLEDLRPDIIHIHHLNYFGVELLALIRRVLPECRIVMTLHDYYMICPNDGLMVRTTSDALCDHASDDRCRACFPDRDPAVFQVRRDHIKRHLELVDLFFSPSEFLRGRFIAWGLSADRIRVMRNGIVTPDDETDCGTDTAADIDASSNPNRFATFGNLRRTKGSLLIAEAAMRAIEVYGADLTLDLNGAALFQPDEFREKLDAVARRSDGRIRLNGLYEPKDVPKLMAKTDWVVCPSLWWENAPLVIDEAFLHSRPVLCSDIGGMAESVTDTVNGYHVPVGNLDAWAQTLARAAEDRESWASLSAAAARPPTIEAMAEQTMATYSGLRRDLGVKALQQAR
jgi:glycosyltransferase involved in cell wall biosynthesis